MYVMKKVGPDTSPRTYIRGEKILSRNFPYSLNIACTDYIRDEKSSSRDFPYSM
jgi:hypothetical protein